MNLVGFTKAWTFCYMIRTCTSACFSLSAESTASRDLQMYVTQNDQTADEIRFRKDISNRMDNLRTICKKMHSIFAIIQTKIAM